MADAIEKRDRAQLTNVFLAFRGISEEQAAMAKALFVSVPAKLKNQGKVSLILSRRNSGPVPGLVPVQYPKLARRADNLAPAILKILQSQLSGHESLAATLDSLKNDFPVACMYLQLHIERLAEAPSNDESLRDGRGVWDRLVAGVISR